MHNQIKSILSYVRNATDMTGCSQLFYLYCEMKAAMSAGQGKAGQWGMKDGWMCCLSWDRAAENWIGQDRTGQDRADQGRAGQDRVKGD